MLSSRPGFAVLGPLRLPIVFALLVLVAPSASAQLTPIGHEFQVNTYTTGSQKNSSVASLDGEEFMVVWTRNDGNSNGVFAQRYDRDANALGSEFQVNPGNHANGRVASMATGSVVVYTAPSSEIRAQRLDPTGVAIGNEFDPTSASLVGFVHPRITDTPNGGFVVLWQERGAFSTGVSMQRYNSQGSKIGGEITIASGGGGGSQAVRTPVAAALNSGNFLVAWGRGNDRILAKLYRPNGQPLVGNTQLNGVSVDPQWPSIAALPSGPFLVAWDEDGGDGDGDGIFARRVGADGTVLGSPFQVNSYTTGSQERPAVARLNDGFFVSWLSSDQDGDGSGIYGQQLSSEGDPVGLEIRLHEAAVGSQTDIRLANLTGGRLLASWTDDSFDGDGRTVVARLFSDGSPEALPDAFVLREDDSFGGNVLDGSLGGLDTDPNGDALTAVLIEGPTNGTLMGGLAADGSFTYQPAADFNGSDSFIYAANDGSANGNTVEVSITVTPVNDAPSFTLPAQVTTNQGPQSLPGVATEISAGPADEASQVLKFDIADNTLPELFDVGPELSSDGTLSFTPSGLVGEASLRIVLRDDGGTDSGGVDTSPSQALIVEIVDEFAPQVVGLEAMPGGALGDCVELRQTANFLVTFNEPMADPAGDSEPGDVSNPANYQLIGAGANGLLDTVSCSELAGDDVLFVPSNVDIDMAEVQATIELDPALPDDLYRLLVCGAVEDKFNNALGETVAAGFRQTVDNEFVNGFFDCTTDAWLTFPDGIDWFAEDADGNESSGSVWLPGGLAVQLELNQCVETVEPSFELSGRLRLDVSVGDFARIIFFCAAYPEPGCGGALIGAANRTVSVGPTAGWLPFDVQLQQDGGVSALCGVFTDSSLGAPYDAYFDSLVLRSSLFSDGFESGDVSAWESSVP